jgi:hypothetical protein
MGDLFNLYNSTEAQWIAAKMTIKQKEISEYYCSK